MFRALWTAVTIAALLPSCQPTRPDTTGGTRPAVVDTVVPRDVALQRFREGFPEVDTLTGGERSAEALIRAFLTAAGTTDTVALRRLVMDRREFAWIYYPTNPQGLAPYDLTPDLLWFMLVERGNRGITHLFERVAGHRLEYVSHECPREASMEGENVIRGPCLVTLSMDGATPIQGRLFGPILERRGRFKFVNYSNKLD